MSPLFLLGNPRSGTTLLRVMLNSHPKVCIPPECGFLIWWLQKYKYWSSADSKNSEKIEEYLSDLVSSKKFDTWDVDLLYVRDLIERNRPASYAELSLCIYQAYAKHRGRSVSIYGDKNNFYTKHVNELHHLFPEAKFVHIIRDGRDVACSYKELSEKRSAGGSVYSPNLSNNIEAIALEWAETVKRTQYCLNELGCEHVVIRYEDLVLETETTCNRIVEFLQLEFSDQMLRYYELESDPNTSSEPSDFLKWKRKILIPPDSKSIGRHCGYLSKRDLMVFENIAGDALRMFSYI